MVVLTLKKGECIHIGQAVQLIIENIENDVVDFAVDETGSKTVLTEEAYWKIKHDSLKASFALLAIPRFTSPTKKHP